MKNVEAAGGAIYRIKDDERQVVLIYRKGLWDLPKGKKEKGETLKDCARREVAEEIGVPLPRIEHFLLKTTHQYKQNDKLYHKETYWYAMQIDEAEDFTPEKEEDITKVAWVEVAEAKEKAAFSNLRKVLERL